MREMVTATPRVKLRFNGRNLSLIPCWSKFSKVTSLFLFQPKPNGKPDDRPLFNNIESLADHRNVKQFEISGYDVTSK